MKVNEEQIDDFLLDRMSQSERQAFAEELEKNRELANQVKVQQQIVGGLAVIGKEQFKARLQRIKEETLAEPIPPEVKGNRVSTRIWWLAAVIAILLAIFLIWKWNGASGEDPNVIYADLFEVYDVPIVQRDTDDQQLIQELSTYYKEGAYSAFIEGFEGRRNEFTDHPELQLSLGISYLQTKQPLKAANVLAQLEESNYPAYRDHARWYRILAALQEGNAAKAQQLLPRLLEDENADHYGEAKELDRRL